MTTAELIAAAIEIGQQMLESGAEIYRVEESMQRICEAYDAKDTHVYAVPTSIIVTVARSGETPITRTRRIHVRGTDLDRLNRLNALCRSICQTPISAQAFETALEEIAARPKYSAWTLRVAFGAISGFFALLFGGSLSGAFVSLCIGIVLKCVLDALEKASVGALFANITGGALIASLALISVKLGITPTYDKIIIGSIMTLVPGLAITNSMRDLIAGDSIAGMTKFTEALVVAAGIAIGVALPLSLVHFLGGL